MYFWGQGGGVERNKINFLPRIKGLNSIKTLKTHRKEGRQNLQNLHIG